MKHYSILISILYFFGIYNLSAQVTGTFTADNSYAVYKGSQSSVSTKLIPTSGNGHTNSSASQIFNPSQRSFNVTNGDYLYIIAWSDDRSCQGLLGEFTGSATIKTGDAGWQVYATDKNYGNNQAPPSSLINQFISVANSNNSWSAPFVGPTNANGKSACSAYRKVAGISNSAKWIWYDSNNSNSAKKVFGTGANHKEFLIFRFPVKMISGDQQTGGGVSAPQTTKCDCIPERAYSVDLTSNIFSVENVTGPIGNFSYNLKFKPNAQYGSISNSWNSYINSSFGISNRKGCRIIHQYILYEYTDGSGGFQETFLEEFWSSPNYTPHSGNQFNTALKSNKKYYIKHGVYYGAADGSKCPLAKDCPWKETRFFIGCSSGSSPSVIMKDEKGKTKRSKSVKSLLKKGRSR